MNRRLLLASCLALALVPALGLAAFVAAGRAGDPRSAPPTLADIARGAGCTLRELEDDREATNPPVTGRFVERIRARDGSYAGRRPPSPLATIHSLLHGRVLFQYRPGLAAAELRALDRLARADRTAVLLFENQTGMRPRVAATAYLSVMACPRVDRATLRALAEFRDRRRHFGQRL